MDKQSTLFDDAPDPWVLDSQGEQVAAEVVFAEPPHGPFDYLVPPAFEAKLRPGQRVEVPLGRGNRPIVGYCTHVATRPAGPRPLKPVARVVDSQPLLSAAMLRLAAWMSDYYLCPLGQVLQAIVPAGVRGQAGTREMTFLNVPEGIQQQLAAGTLKVSPKQLDALKILAGSPRPLTPPELAQAAKCTLGPIAELRKKRLVSAQVRRVQQMEVHEPVTPREEHLQLNADQQAALACILAALRERRHETVLMHGVTGSGKTEVYIRAIEEALHYGRQAIVLVPEISLTPQTRQRFRSRFGSVAVLHSHLSDAERHWHWQQIAAGEVQVVVGARSAVFAPVPHLGLIVIDEEHDASFKQGEQPRYHARDVALERAAMEGVPLVLGSATPSLESWQRTRPEFKVQGSTFKVAETGSVATLNLERGTSNSPFTLIDMPRRVEDRPLPAVATIDLRTEFQNRASRGAVSRSLHRAIGEALAEEGQVILLLNRRGYSTHIQCPACGHVVKCPHCDLSLTHHRQEEKVICHYCDFEEASPVRCPECAFDGIRYAGFGTERLEGEIKARFPGVPIVRMDSDTMQRPGSHEEALAKFRAGETKILLGTQMIAKGLDFPNVTLVGVVNADTTLHFADLRAAERTFQLVTQVAGRTGRGDKGGRVLVQTFSPDHYAILAAIEHDYARFAAAELPSRREHLYPPYASLVRLIVRGESETAVEQFIEATGEKLRDAITATGCEHKVLGPAPCPIAKLRGLFRWHVLMSCVAGDVLRSAVRGVLEKLEPIEGIQWVVDVDPVDLL
ncbi:MAG: primosomal protein N' [Pirellulaceae bacterium]|nr:primosomal protein N' [Pirellulaceae bacterium]